jgi:hypothetical protein
LGFLWECQEVLCGELPKSCPKVTAQLSPAPKAGQRLRERDTQERKLTATDDMPPPPRHKDHHYPELTSVLLNVHKELPNVTLFGNGVFGYITSLIKVTSN